MAMSSGNVGGVQVLQQKEEVAAERVRFPGSQPVSLDRTNIELLRHKRYRVTWKADGTRYMLLICKWSTYLLDRSFDVRRVQVRCTILQLFERANAR
jgi:hypothetical protein